MIKNILVLGGTGAMGTPLVQQLAQENNVYVTSRRKRQLSNSSNITYIQGNAKDVKFLADVLSQRRWDSVVDFMVWGKLEFSPQ